jgi:Tfp pilus assembly protein PilN
MTLNRWIAILAALAMLTLPTLSLADHHEAGEEAAEQDSEKAAEESDAEDSTDDDADEKGSESED